MNFYLTGAAAAVVIVITLFLIKRHDKKKDKLGGLPTGITGAETCSKDYQELCRARMAGKGTTADSGRITTLAKESEKPPSSRSSTSSWSEEPALTNMDISTGHMVLVSEFVILQLSYKNLLKYSSHHSSLTWRTIYVTKDAYNENGKHCVDTRPNQALETQLYNQNATILIDKLLPCHSIILV